MLANVRHTFDFRMAPHKGKNDNQQSMDDILVSEVHNQLVKRYMVIGCATNDDHFTLLVELDLDES